MALNLEAKKAVVDEVAAVAREARSAIAAEYRGLTVADMTRLRVNAKQAGAYVRVVRNTLARRALADTEFDCMRDGLVGPLVLVFSREDPGCGARVVRDFARENARLQVRLVAFGGKLLEPNDIELLANLPTYEEAVSRLMSVMLGPVTKLARTLAEPHAKLVRTIAAIRDQKQAA